MGKEGTKGLSGETLLESIGQNYQKQGFPLIINDWILELAWCTFV